LDIKKIKSWLPLIIIILLIIAAWLSGVADMVNLEFIKSKREYLLAMVGKYPILSLLTFIFAYISAVALSLPISSMLTLLGGFLFGRWVGTIAIVTGATIGAAIIFTIAKSSLGSILRDKAGGLYKKVAKNMEADEFSYMLFMRLVPVFPFFLVNILPALFNVRIIPYIITTFIGIIPGTFIYANLGRELGTINSLSDLASPATLIAFTLLGCLALVPILYKKIKSKVVKK